MSLLLSMGVASGLPVLCHPEQRSAHISGRVCGCAHQHLPDGHAPRRGCQAPRKACGRLPPSGNQPVSGTFLPDWRARAGRRTVGAQHPTCCRGAAGQPLGPFRGLLHRSHEPLPPSTPVREKKSKCSGGAWGGEKTVSCESGSLAKRECDTTHCGVGGTECPLDTTPGQSAQEAGRRDRPDTPGRAVERVSAPSPPTEHDEKRGEPASACGRGSQGQQPPR